MSKTKRDVGDIRARDGQLTVTQYISIHSRHDICKDRSSIITKKKSSPFRLCSITDFSFLFIISELKQAKVLDHIVNINHLSLFA